MGIKVLNKFTENQKILLFIVDSKYQLFCPCIFATYKNGELEVDLNNINVRYLENHFKTDIYSFLRNTILSRNKTDSEKLTILYLSRDIESLEDYSFNEYNRCRDKLERVNRRGDAYLSGNANYQCKIEDYCQEEEEERITLEQLKEAQKTFRRINILYIDCSFRSNFSFYNTYSNYVDFILDLAEYIDILFFRNKDFMSSLFITEFIVKQDIVFDSIKQNILIG